MKVLIIRNAYRHDFGGAERLTVNLAGQLESQNIQTIVMSRQPRLLAFATARGIANCRGWWWSRQNWSGLRTLLLPIYMIWQVVLTVWYLVRLSRLKVDIVHIVSRDDFIAASVAARILGKPVFWTDCADLKYVYANYSVWYKNLIGKWVFRASRLAHSIFLVSRSEEALVRSSIGRALPANYVVAYLGVTDQVVEPVARSASDKAAVIFCATSRLVISKGIGELIEAFSSLTAADQYRLWLVGDGPDEAAFKAQAAANPHITFVGHSDTPLAYVAACDVFVHPSYHEGFSLSLLEAAMLAKPIVACDVGGNPELVDAKNGALVPPKDSAALAAAMTELGADHSARLAQGAAGRSKFMNHFELGKIVKTQVIPRYEAALQN